MRRPSLKSSLYMTLLAVGIVGAGILIFRGAGAPREPARAVAPVIREIRLDEPGTYVILAEQVIAPRAQDVEELTAPEMKMKLRRVSAGQLAEEVLIEEPGLAAWVYKVFTRQRGKTFGQFSIERAGAYRLNVCMIGDAENQVPDRGVVLAFARTTSPGRFLWLLLGFGGQICFSLRFIIQWLASEKAGRSTVPRAFWYYSLFGGLMILAYAIYTRDPVFIMAYAFNAFIYVRNLVLIRREDRALARAAAGAEEGK